MTKDNFPTTLLKDIVDYRKGHAFKSKDYQNIGVPIVRVSDFENRTINPSNLYHVSKKVAEENKKATIKKFDILITTVGASAGNFILVPPFADNYLLNQNAVRLRTKSENELEKKFLFYSLINKNFTNYLLAGAQGSAQPSIVLDQILDTEITYPEERKRKKIAKILGTFDDKIHLNNQINQTLEAIAQAIFKSWFIDFDPVKAKAEVLAQGGSQEEAELAAMCTISGKSTEALQHMQTTHPEQYRKLKKTAAAFPSTFVDSELGEIPEGWEVLPLNKIAHYQNGLALQKFRPENENDFLPIVKIAQLKQGVASSEEKASPNIDPKCIIDNGDVIFSWSGSLMVDIWCGGKAALNQHLFKVTSNKYPKWFYYLYTKHHLAEFQRIAADKAVTMGHIKREHLSQALCVVPENHYLLNNLIENIIQESIKNKLENISIAKIRDEFLPELLSGKIFEGC